MIDAVIRGRPRFPRASSEASTSLVDQRPSFRNLQHRRAMCCARRHINLCLEELVMKWWTSVAIAVTIFVAGSLPVGAATFTGTLSGAAEENENNSPGTGPVEVELDPVGHVLRVDASFSGLVSPSTMAHIHCCAPPGVS